MSFIFYTSVSCNVACLAMASRIFMSVVLLLSVVIIDPRNLNLSSPPSGYLYQRHVTESHRARNDNPKLKLFKMIVSCSLAAWLQHTIILNNFNLGLSLFTLCLCKPVYMHWTVQSTKTCKFCYFVGSPTAKKLSASGGFCPTDPTPGALPLDPAGVSAPRPPAIGSRSALAITAPNLHTKLHLWVYVALKYTMKLKTKLKTV